MARCLYCHQQIKEHAPYGKHGWFSFSRISNAWTEICRYGGIGYGRLGQHRKTWGGKEK